LRGLRSLRPWSGIEAHIARTACIWPDRSQARREILRLFWQHAAHTAALLFQRLSFS